jgi:hypothetical protein
MTVTVILLITKSGLNIAKMCGQCWQKHKRHRPVSMVFEKQMLNKFVRAKFTYTGLPCQVYFLLSIPERKMLERTSINYINFLRFLQKFKFKAPVFTLLLLFVDTKICKCYERSI